MEWLLKLVLRRGMGASADMDELVVTEPESKEVTGPELLLLIPDASDLCAYQLHTFPDAASAVEWVKHCVRFKLDHGILAFWALHGKPTAGPGAEGEVMILMRNGARPDLVYPWSLLNMEHARSWLAKAAIDGLDLQSVLLYWAVPVKVHHDNGGRVWVSPTDAPRPENRGMRRRPPIADKDGTDSTDAAESETPIPSDEAQSERKWAPVLEEVVVEARHEAEHMSKVDEGTQAALAEPESQALEQGVADRLIADAMGESRATAKPRFKQQRSPFRGFGSPKGKF